MGVPARPGNRKDRQVSVVLTPGQREALGLFRMDLQADLVRDGFSTGVSTSDALRLLIHSGLKRMGYEPGPPPEID